MAVEFPGNAIPAPGYRKGNVSVDQELQYSAVGFSQKGVTLKAGQGVLLLGTVLARDTASKRYVKYVSGGTGGAGTAVGILRKTVDTGTDPQGAEFLANIVFMGVLKLPLISAANGGVPNVLGAVSNTVLGTFKI